MSSPAVQVRRALRPSAPALAKARLRVVPLRRARAPRMPFVALVTLLLVGGVVGLLMFNTSMQQASFAATALDEQATALNERQQTLEMELEQMRDPQRVARAAQDLGMVVPGNAGYIQPDGSIRGKATPADGTLPLRLAPRPAVRPKVLDPAPVVAEGSSLDRASEKSQRDDRGTASQRGNDGPNG